jgi:hypothetical protein
MMSIMRLSGVILYSYTAKPQILNNGRRQKLPKKKQKGATKTLTGAKQTRVRTGKQKTSFIVDQELWKKWILFVVDRRGSARKLSQELEAAMNEYMKNHKKTK